MKLRTALLYLSLVLAATALTQFHGSIRPIMNGRVSRKMESSGIRSGANLRVIKSYGKLPLSFEANQGQTDSQVKFLSRGNGYSLFLTSNEAVLALNQSRDRQGAVTQPRIQNKTGPLANARGSDWFSAKSVKSVDDAVLRMKLVGANPAAQVTGMDELPGKSNYFIGNDPKQWRTNVPTYAKVRYENVYPGIDLVYYGNQRQLEYDFVVSPGADPQAIRLAIGRGDPPGRPYGAVPLRIDPQGDLVAHVAGEEIRLRKPAVYQDVDGARREVPGGYVLEASNEVSFRLAAYDKAKPLTVDPVLVYSTYLGGSGVDQGNSIAVDSSGNAYVAGYTNSTNFPTASPVQAAIGGAGATNAFVAKLNATGTALVYSTYLGGSGNDHGNGIAVDSSGNAYVTGGTTSANFPITVGAFQTTYTGTTPFVTKLNATGSALSYSTYLGGGGSSSAIAVDSGGNAYVTGWANDGNFPTTSGAFQQSSTNGCGLFVTKFNPSGTGLIYSTRVTGSVCTTGDANGIAVDASGNAYVAGLTYDKSFPTTPGAFQSTAGAGVLNGLGVDNGVVFKLNSAGAALIFSTFLGGSSADQANAIAIDSSGDAYLTGTASSLDFPITTGAFQTTLGGGSSDAFVTKLNASGTALVYSTYLGGNGTDQANGIAVDSSGNAYVTGRTYSTNFPITAGAFQTTTACCSQAFVTKLNATGAAPIYSSYLGGLSNNNAGNGIAVDASGNAYVVGNTSSANFPTVDPIQATLAGSTNAFIAKISANNPLPALTSLSPSSATAGGNGFVLTVNGSNFVAGAVVQWNGSPLVTTFVSSTQLTASIPASDIATAGSAQVTVFDPSPGGGTSNALPFTILAASSNPVPVISMIAPASVTAGGADFVVRVTGLNFVLGATVEWNGSSRITSFVSSTDLRAWITAADIAAAGTAQVTVFNPAPGGGTSNSVAFNANNPQPAPTGLSPANATAGGAQFTLTVNGTGFVPSSVVQWNGSARSTTFVSATQVSATITAADIAAAGTSSVTVVNPAPGGGTSSALTFSVVSPGNNPLPMIVSLSPSVGSAGSAGFTLTVNGLNFLATSTVQWNASARGTTFVSSTQLTAAITSTDLSGSGSAQITVLNPAPSGGVSNAVEFTIEVPGSNPVPVITSISPTSATAATAGFTLTVNGSGFTAASQVCVTLPTSALSFTCTSTEPELKTTTFVSNTQLQAAINDSDIALPVTAQLAVINPAPGGGVSNILAFSVFPPTSNPVPVISSLVTDLLVPGLIAGLQTNSIVAGSASFNLIVNGLNFVPGSVVQWNGSGRVTTFGSRQTLSAAILASDIATAGFAQVTVLNPAPGGGLSSPATFTILPATDPVPVLASLVPASATAGGPGFSMELSGTQFSTDSVVRWNGANRTTTYVSSTQLTALISSTDIAQAGTAQVAVYNPATGGGLSNILTFTINSVSVPSGGGGGGAAIVGTYPPVIAPSVTSLTFSADSGGLLPPSQTITVANSASSNGAPPLNWTASILFLTSRNWLALSPTTGTDNGVITVSVPVTSFPAGQYNAIIQIRDPNASNSPEEVPVTLTVATAPSLLLTPASLPFAGGTGSSPATQSIAITSSGDPLNWTATATTTSGGNWLNLSSTSGTTPATLTVSVNTSGLSGGTYQGTITVSSPSAGNFARSVGVTLTITQSNLPTIETGGIVNGASFAAGSPVAPGSIISIFGSNLASSTLTASSTPLPTTLLGTSATINATQIPLYYASPGQINAQVPFEIPPGPATLVVTENGVSSLPVTFSVAATAPGIFLYGANRAVAVNPDGSANASNHPAKPGDVIVVYMTGQGAVSNPPPDGAPALGSSLSTTLAPTTATIGGANAAVIFSGLAPGFVGLLQVNLQIPTVAAGDQPLVVMIRGAASNSALISVASQ